MHTQPRTTTLLHRCRMTIETHTYPLLSSIQPLTHSLPPPTHSLAHSSTLTQALTHSLSLKHPFLLLYLAIESRIPLLNGYSVGFTQSSSSSSSLLPLTHSLLPSSAHSCHKNQVLVRDVITLCVPIFTIFFFVCFCGPASERVRIIVSTRSLASVLLVM